MSDLCKQFDAVAKQYDQQRKQLIPCFDDYYNMALSVMDAIGSKKPQPRILDLGTGTGLFAAMVLHQFPDAEMTLVDLSEQMLDAARKRFAGKNNVHFIQDDYITHEWKEPFDMVVSGLSIHHLSDEQKQQLFTRIFNILEPGGIFVNADQALGSTPEMEAMYASSMKTVVETSGLPPEEIAKAFERLKLDRSATMENQLQWLRESGFVHSECVYKYNHFTVFLAVKGQA